MSMKVTELDIKWGQAALCFEHRGEPGPLAELMRSGAPVSAFVRPFLARIISGELKLPSQRGKANSTLNWRAKRQIEEGLGKVYRNSEIVMCFADELADEMRIEPIDIRREMEGVRRSAIKALETRYDMSESGIRKIANPSLSSAFGRALCGIEPEGTEGDFLERIAEQRRGNEGAHLEFARRIYKARGEFFDPLTETDELPEY